MKGLSVYGKIFDSMYEGTLYGHWEAIVTLQQMLVLCNRDGVIDMTTQAIAARTSIPLKIITKGIGILSEPDLHSRTPGEDGRRIILIDDRRPWGWLIVNYVKYRDMKSREEKNAADRLRIAEQRKARKNKDVADCSNLSQGVANVAYAPVAVDVPVTASGPVTATTNQEKANLSAAACASPPPQGQRGNGKGNGKEKPEPPTRETWAAYSSAYQQRYGVEPIRNKTVNSKVKQFVERIGIDEAPSVAASYLSSNRGLYVSAKHPVDLLLRDAETLRTEWVTHQHGTETEGRMADRTATVGNVFNKLIQESREAKKNGH